MRMITKQITQVGGSGFTNSEDAAIYLIHVDGKENVRKFIRSFMTVA
jgi:hypothetical protein